MVGDWEQNLGNFPDSFVAHHAEDHGDLAGVLVGGRESRAQRPGTGWVVGYIEHILWIVSSGWHHLEPPGPVRLADALRDGFGRDLGRPLVVQFLGGGYG